MRLMNVSLKSRIPPKTELVYTWEDNKFVATGTKTFDLAKMSNPEHYTVRFSLDDELALFRNAPQPGEDKSAHRVKFRRRQHRAQNFIGFRDG